MAEMEHLAGQFDEAVPDRATRMAQIRARRQQDISDAYTMRNARPISIRGPGKPYSNDLRSSPPKAVQPSASQQPMRKGYKALARTQGKLKY